MRYLYGFVLLLFLGSCSFKPTYPKETLLEDLSRIVSREFHIDNMKTKIDGNCIWIYIPINQLMDDQFQLSEESAEKIRQISSAISRILLSSDSDITFISMITHDANGVELRMLRHIEDVKKVRVWYISYQDFYYRSDVRMDFNPELIGLKTVNSLINKTMEAGYTDRDLGKYILLKKRNEITEKFPADFGEIKKVNTVRVGDNEALVYIESGYPARKSLFLINVEFSEILKNLLILYLSKKEEASAEAGKAGRLPDEPAKENAALSYPVIAGYWEIGEEAWPYEYREYRNVDMWPGMTYSKAIKFNEFISAQIERKIKLKFKDNDEKWKIKFKELNVYYLESIIEVTRDMYSLKDPDYKVDPDHEIALIAAQTIKNYDLDNIQSLVIHTPLWEIKKDMSVEELMKLKPVKWKRIRKKADFTMKDMLLMMFIPNYRGGRITSEAKEVSPQEKWIENYRMRQQQNARKR
ncbi:MAG: hypothetical protein JXJ19_00160 [Elusimicrobia bacterium]|nr:hypothetical protein [Elusimicrobiota bacterium]